jgi:hypothetical protein
VRDPGWLKTFLSVIASRNDFEVVLCTQKTSQAVHYHWVAVCDDDCDATHERPSRPLPSELVTNCHKSFLFIEYTYWFCQITRNEGDFVGNRSRGASLSCERWLTKGRTLLPPARHLRATAGATCGAPVVSNKQIGGKFSGYENRDCRITIGIGSITNDIYGRRKAPFRV